MIIRNGEALGSVLRAAVPAPKASKPTIEPRKLTPKKAVKTSAPVKIEEEVKTGGDNHDGD